MAKKVEEKVEKKIMKVKGLVNIKYDENCFKIGDEFAVRKEDSEEMSNKGYVELLQEVKTVENESKEQGETTKEGE